jgi:ribosomal-protein-alanine N-acetyltransferase
MQIKDLKLVSCIEQATQFVPWTEKIFHDCLQVGYQGHVLHDDTQILGFAVLALGASECHVLNLAITPERQGQGLGHFFMRRLLTMLKYLNVEHVFLEVRVTNQAAQSLYKKLGFKQLGYRKEYYAAKQGREDAIVMSLALRQNSE